MLLWHNIHRVWLAIHMWPYLPNGFLIWVDRSTIRSPASTVMHLTRNKAEINFPWTLCGAFWMAACLCRREHLLHFCWPLCPFPYEQITPIEMITAFQSVVKTTRHTFENPIGFQSTLPQLPEKWISGTYRYESGKASNRHPTTGCQRTISLDLFAS